MVLPATWAGAECARERTGGEGQSGVGGGSSEDILVTGRHPLFGSRPWSLQHGGCAVRGQRVELPYPGLLGDNGTEAGADDLLRELVKYRFGVFEERGLNGDRLYPLEFAEGEERRVAQGCNGSEVRIEEKCRPFLPLHVALL